MNEFYSPRRENKNTNETAYAEPADELNIVVDDNDTGAAFCSKCGNRLILQPMRSKDLWLFAKPDTAAVFPTDGTGSDPDGSAAPECL